MSTPPPPGVSGLAALDYHDRRCVTCGATRPWIQFFPRSPSAKAWNRNCAGCVNTYTREPLPPPIYKKCSDCGKEKQLPGFLIDSGGHRDIDGQCRACRRRRAR